MASLPQTTSTTNSNSSPEPKHDSRGRLHLRTRRQLALAITVSLIALVWVASRLESVRLGSPAMLTGWTVLACVVGLMMIGVRRRLPFEQWGVTVTINDPIGGAQLDINLCCVTCSA